MKLLVAFASELLCAATSLAIGSTGAYLVLASAVVSLPPDSLVVRLAGESLWSQAVVISSPGIVLGMAWTLAKYAVNEDEAAD